MEFVLKHAQDYMKPSQTAVVCLHAGLRYRWWSLGCLLGLMTTGLLMTTYRSESIDLQSLYGMTIIAMIVLWSVQLGILALLSFYFHPEMHLRVSPSMSAEEIHIERRRVGAAIVNMAITVRFELAFAIIAVLLGAALHFV